MFYNKNGTLHNINCSKQLGTLLFSTPMQKRNSENNSDSDSDSEQGQEMVNQTYTHSTHLTTTTIQNGKIIKIIGKAFYKDCVQLTNVYNNDLFTFNKELTVQIIKIVSNIPQTKPINKPNTVPWWTDEIKNKCACRNHLNITT